MMTIGTESFGLSMLRRLVAENILSEGALTLQIVKTLARSLARRNLTCINAGYILERVALGSGGPQKCEVIRGTKDTKSCREPAADCS